MEVINMDWKATAIKELKNYEFYKRNIANLENRLANAGTRMTSPRTSACSAAPVHGGGNRYEDKMIDFIDERDEIRVKIIKAKKPLEDIDTALNALDECERIVLERFFIRRGGNPITELREILHYERTKIYDIQGEALNKFIFAMYGETA